jgi:hypothetical protein
MGALLPFYRKAIIDDVVENVSNDTSYYYAFASYPFPNSGSVPSVTLDIESSVMSNLKYALFGKRLTPSDVAPFIRRVTWQSSNVYASYDHTDPNLYGKDFYVITDPDIVGGSYDVYVCVYNANGGPSTQKPNLLQSSAFEKSDGYIWRYVTSIPNQTWTKFSTSVYAPIVSNGAIVAGATTSAGIDYVRVTNVGSNYTTFTEGKIQSVQSSTRLQLQNDASSVSNYYANCDIYVYRPGYNVSQLLSVSSYVSNSSGKWVTLSSEANVASIFLGETRYVVSPRVKFTTDGVTQPRGYAVVNTVAKTIERIVMVDTGSSISRAEARLESTVYGNGAVLTPIVPPPGGYGYDVATQLNVLGMAITFSFANTEANTIPTNLTYTRVGIIRNPHAVTNTGARSASRYSNATFNQLMMANISPSVSYSLGDVLTGETSGSVATVVTANSTVISMVGDKTFSNGEYVTTNSGIRTVISINKRGDVYHRDLTPIYVQNINDAIRSNTETETYKLLIRIG